MTFTASDMGLVDVSLGFLARRCKQYTSLKHGRDGSTNGRIQLQILTGVGACDVRHRAGLAQIWRPLLARGFKQAAYLRVPAAEIVSIKVRALRARWSFHTLIISLPL